MIKNFLILMSVCFVLTACTPEPNYRGVPATAWQKLTPEQKQLIVDQSYQTEFKGQSRS